MDTTGINPAVMAQIRNLAECNGMEKVLLFGSRARGDYSRASDIDLAVSGGNPDAFHYHLENETDTLLTYDVVSLDSRLKAGLLDSILKEGICLYEKI